MLGGLSIIFVRWFRSTRSFWLLLTEHFKPQPEFIYPRDYTSLITGIIVSFREIGFIFGLGNYVLPVMIISTWLLTVSLLRPYIQRIGKKKFWLLYRFLLCTISSGK